MSSRSRVVWFGCLLGLCLSACGPTASRPTPGQEATGTTIGGATLTAVALTAGQATSVSGAKDEQKLFTLQVPPGQKVLNFKTSGGTGDVDLFVQFGAEPTTTSYRCASTAAGNTELCAIDNPEAGTWYVMTRGYAAFATVSLLGEYAPLANVLGSGQFVTVSGAAGSQRYWTVSVPAGQTALHVRTMGGSGNPDLYVSFDTPPTTTAATCTSARSDSSIEECNIANPQAGTWYIMVRGTTDYTNVRVTSSLQAADGTPVMFLGNDRVESPLSASVNELLNYAIEVPPGQTVLRVRTTSSMIENSNLYVRFNERATTTTYDCLSEQPYAIDECVINNPQAGTWYIQLHAKSAFIGVALQAYYANGALAPQELTPGKPSSGFTLMSASDTRAFTLSVPPNAGKLRISVNRGDNAISPTVYLAYGALPKPTNSSTYACSSTSSCEVNEPQAGTWYVLATTDSTIRLNTTLRVWYSGEVSAPVALVNGQALSGISASPDDNRYYTLNVPTGQRRLRFDMTSSAGQPRIAIRSGTRPVPADTSSYNDCQGTLTDGRTSCVFDLPVSGLWYVRMRATKEVADFFVRATFTATAPELPTEPLTVGQWVTDLSGTYMVDRFYSFSVPVGMQSLKFEPLPGDGNAAYLMQAGAKPPATGGSTCTSACEITAPTSGTWYVRVRGRENYTGAGLRVSLQQYPELPMNQWVGPLASSQYGSGRFFRIEVPSGLSALTLEGRLGNGSFATLQATRSTPPTTSVDCNGVQPDGGRRCVIANPQAGTWFLQAGNPTGNTTDVTLRASADRLPDSTLTLADNVPLALTDFAGRYRYLTLNVPAGQTLLTVDLLTQQDAELYVKQGSAPTTTSYKCMASSTQAQPGASCAVQAPASGLWYVMVKAEDGFQGRVRATTSTTRTLTSGISEVAISGALGEQRLYQFDVAPGMSDLAFNLRNTTGTANLFVRYGTPPDNTTSDCTVQVVGKAEDTCAFSQPQAGTWYAAVRAVSAAFTGAVLTATSAQTPGEGVPELTRGVAINGLHGEGYAVQLYKLEVPAGQSLLKFNLSGGDGFADLYIQRGVRPTMANPACFAEGTSGNVATCLVQNPEAGTWFVAVGRAYAFSGASLTGTYSNEGDVFPLARGAPVPNLSSTPVQAQYFQVEVPAGQGFLSLDLFGGGANAVMTARAGALPTASDTACAVKTTSRRACEIQNPTPGLWYVRLSGTFNGALLSADYDAVGAPDGIQPLVNRALVINPSCINASSPLQYKLEVPPGATKLTFVTQGTVSCNGAGIDLRVLLGSPATQTDYDCLSNNVGSAETCTFQSPAAGTWYVRLSGVASSVGVVGTYE
ncbi:PPC domain-containing protein [Corallococcus sp. M34]|uniref:PPC domain-containing protein n=1 Tax=Citreicoccus inhibens TaxID=2849499 RepID=UPI001C250587|nr:PPC domain-containing protein [Citreicoccus inhibens]MBU8895353.1 PPC domain-containing protein [Citreicoccus inhibens]